MGNTKLTKRQMFINTMIAVAKGEVGSTEVGGNNIGPAVVKYQKATWLKPSPWPWCAAFICYVFKEAERILGYSPVTGKRPRTAGAYDFENWANNQSVKDGSYQARAGQGAVVITPGKSFRFKAGDIIIYNYSHIELCIEDGNYSKFKVIGGNTGSGDERDGDGVWDKYKTGKKVRWVIRFTD